MYYTYILQSEKDGSYYIGATEDIKKRLLEHNSNQSKFTSTKTPYKLVWWGAFQSKELAFGFERYLKSSSGFAFRNKHLI